ncbi:MAG: hypothetical protein ABFC24_04985 [Methanoregulaceae archaeon]
MSQSAALRRLPSARLTTAAEQVRCNPCAGAGIPASVQMTGFPSRREQANIPVQDKVPRVIVFSFFEDSYSGYEAVRLFSNSFQG